MLTALNWPDFKRTSSNVSGSQMRTKFNNVQFDTVSGSKFVSSNYFHMGNLWRTYRVLSTTTTFSAENMMFQNSTGSYRATAHGVLNLFATGDPDMIASATVVETYTRPAIFGNRYGVTQTMGNQYSAPSTIRHTCSAQTLVNNIYPSTTEAYSGECTPGTNGAMPGYSQPEKVVYHGWTFHPYGASGSGTPRCVFLPDSTLLQGYITVSYRVLFTNPHSNSEFTRPL